MKNELDKLAFEKQGKSMGLNCLFLALWAILLAVILLIAAGCATIKEKAMDELDRQAKRWIEKLEGLPDVKPTPPEEVAKGDAVPFADLRWNYGGFNGANAQLDRVKLSNFRFDGRNVWYTFDTDLSVWGMSHGDHRGALSCIFVQRDGVWVGGKFDWVSSSREHRGLAHLEHYNGWHESLPITGPVAFVIVSPDGKRRSNVVAEGIGK